MVEEQWIPLISKAPSCVDGLQPKSDPQPRSHRGGNRACIRCFFSLKAFWNHLFIFSCVPTDMAGVIDYRFINKNPYRGALSKRGDLVLCQSNWCLARGTRQLCFSRRLEPASFWSAVSLLLLGSHMHHFSISYSDLASVLLGFFFSSFPFDDPECGRIFLTQRRHGETDLKSEI